MNHFHTNFGRIAQKHNFLFSIKCRQKTTTVIKYLEVYFLCGDTIYIPGTLLPSSRHKSRHASTSLNSHCVASSSCSSSVFSVKVSTFFSRSSILFKIFCMVSLGMLTVSLQQTEDSWMYCKNVNFLTWHVMFFQGDCSTLQYFINLLLSSCSYDCTMYCRLSSGLLWIDRLCRCLLLNTDLSRWLWGSYLGTTLLLNNSICGIHLWCERRWQQMSTSSSTLELSSAIKFNSLQHCFAVVCSVGTQYNYCNAGHHKYNPLAKFLWQWCHCNICERYIL